MSYHTYIKPATPYKELWSDIPGSETPRFNGLVTRGIWLDPDQARLQAEYGIDRLFLLTHTLMTVFDLNMLEINRTTRYSYALEGMREAVADGTLDKTEYEQALIDIAHLTFQDNPLAEIYLDD